MADARVNVMIVPTVLLHDAELINMPVGRDRDALLRAIRTPPPLSYVEPCPDCAAGDCCWCDGKTLDHALDEFVPCPCRAAGHAAPKEI